MKIVIGISGASGVIMGHKLLKALKAIDSVETHLVMTEGAKTTWNLETNIPLSDIENLADHVYDDNNLGALISSGSFKTDGMIVIPCSMKTLSGISTGYASNLLVRSVDVCLKENRKVVIVPREMPLGKVHIRNLKEVSDLGCTIIPPILTFYNGASSLDEQIDHIIGKILMQFNLDHKKFVPWNGDGLN